MRNTLFPVGYCTNVHPGRTLDEALSQIDTVATQVRAAVVPDGVLPIGLWFSETAAENLLSEKSTDWLADWLKERGLAAYTLNGFPQGNFHQPLVRHTVYEPTWTCGTRATYTQRLGQILESLIPAGSVGSISTLPLGWPHAPWHADDFCLAAEHLHATARFFHRLAEHRGCEIVLAIEPEPGCVLGNARDLVSFFERYLFSGPDAEVARQHLTVCHDVCHGGVMFEPQAEALELVRSAGIRIGKVQISSAVHVPWDEMVGQANLQAELLEQVQAFNEPRYLHQTTRSNGSGRLDAIREDLSLALAQWVTDENYPNTPWRIHFHVPIYLERSGQLTTTRHEIAEACNYLEQHRHDRVSDRDWFTGHYEVETYAWSVLPSELAETDLAGGIAKELEYFDQIASRSGNSE